MSRSARPARTGVVAASAAAGVLLLAACAPATTMLPYAPSDGVRVNVTDELRGLNLMVVSEGDGAPGNLLGALSNNTSEDVVFTLAAEGAGTLSLPVAANDTVYLGTEDGVEALLEAVVVEPGADLEASLTAGNVSSDFFLPVLDGTLPEYAEYLPEAP